MKRNVSQVCLSLGLLVSACGTQAVAPVAPAPAASTGVTAKPAQKPDAARFSGTRASEPGRLPFQDPTRTSFPDSLTCVSDPIPSEQVQPQVLRVSVSPSAEGGATLQVQRGPQF